MGHLFVQCAWYVMCDFHNEKRNCDNSMQEESQIGSKTNNELYPEGKTKDDKEK